MNTKFYTLTDIEKAYNELQNKYNDLISEANQNERNYLVIKEKYDELQEEVNKLKVELREKNLKFQLLESENKKLKKDLSEVGMIKKTRQITDEQVKEIKELRAKGLSYRAIQNQTGWSSVTINRVLNGIYD